mmetsp:Transcript_4868/g.9010  ORF Transcript_4868/g.9010 Transcript_4868/m.9010 type:complete len:172 (+) Transcript_4868:73-588(+)
MKMKLPKGMSADDCDRPACDDTVSALSAALRRVSKNKGVTENEASLETTLPREYSACPPNSAELGRSTWTLLHSMAAWYPDEPSTEDEHFMTSFMASFARFYPCPWCATDFQQNLAAKPVQTESRKALSVWICEQHNIVNKKLGKKAFPCDMKSLDERWRRSTDPKCQPKH